MLVVACNTASIAGLDTLRQTFPNIPIVGMEPAVKPAAKATQNGRIGVLATGVTLNGDRFTSLINRYASHIVVINQPCPGLVELVESGHLQGPKTTALLKQYLHPLLEQHIDTLVLGCTHYPFLYQAIQDIVGPNISIIDTGQAVAKQVQKVLSNHQLLKIKATPPEDCFYTSGDPIQVKNAITILLNKKIISVQQKDFSYITKANKYIYTQV